MVCERHGWVVIASVLSLLVNVVLNVLLIPDHGVVGAAAATLATEIFRAIVTSRVASRDGFRLPALRRFWRPFAATAAMVYSTACRTPWGGASCH